MKTVLLSQKIHPQAMEMLDGKYEVLIPLESGQKAFDELIPRADAVILRTNLRISEYSIKSAQKLKIICRTGAGVDNVPIQAARKAGIVVTNVPNANSISVAEHAVGLAIALAKQYPKYDHETRNGGWAIRTSNQAVELFGKTVGIVGLGHIGRNAAEMFRCGFKMNVIGFDPFVKQEDCPEYTITNDLEYLFMKSDIISVHCPSTPDTRGIINKHTLALMKKGAFLVNCARGDIVVEEDLYNALTDGATLQAAALDVFQEEPLPVDSPFVGLKNVILTPHSAALTKEASIRMATQAVEQMITFFNEETPPFIV